MARRTGVRLLACGSLTLPSGYPRGKGWVGGGLGGAGVRDAAGAAGRRLVLATGMNCPVEAFPLKKGKSPSLVRRFDEVGAAVYTVWQLCSSSRPVKCTPSWLSVFPT